MPIHDAPSTIADVMIVSPLNTQRAAFRPNAGVPILSRTLPLVSAPTTMLAIRGRRLIGRLVTPPVVTPLQVFKTLPFYSDRAYKISGITKDSSGAALANCTVDLFYTSDEAPNADLPAGALTADVLAARTTSDASGVYSFSVGPNKPCYIVAYKAGSPDVAGTTVNTLVGA